MSMSLREMRYVLKVSELHSVTRAADALHITQPALSRLIRDVESELGVRIFDRSTNPISLTFAGECYIESAKRILLEHERLRKEIRDITQHMTGRLRIGTSRDRASFMMPKLLPPFCGKYPGIVTEVFTESGKRLREALHDGRIDLLILPDTMSEDRHNFVSEHIYSEELVLVARRGTIQNAKRGAVIPESLDGMKFFMLFREHAIRSFCDSWFRKHNVTPKVLMEFPSNITCYRMAASGMGVCIVPSLTTQMMGVHDDVEIFSLGDEPVTWEVKAFYRKGAYIGEPERELIQIAREIFSA